MTARASAAAALALLAVACSPAPPRAEIRATLLPSRDGGSVSDDDLRHTVTEVHVILGEMGFERREVAPLPGGRLRVVLPDVAIPRIPEVRERLADPALRLRVE